MKRRSNLLISLLILVFHNATAQYDMKLRTEWYNEEDGLSSNIIYDYAQDKKGLMWIGTANGLNRFDGKNFLTFKKNFTDSNSLLSNIVIRVAVDQQNRVWVGYQSGISCYDQLTRTFTHYYPDSTNPDAIGDGIIDELITDNQNRVWIGVGGKGLYCFDPRVNKFTWFGMLPFVSKKRSLSGQKYYNRLSQMILGKEGKLFIGSADGFYSFDTTAKKFEVYRMDKGEEDISKFKKDVFNAICRMNDSVFYLGGWGTGLNYCNIKTGQWKTYLLSPETPEIGTANIINSIERKSDHELWVASNDTTFCIFDTRDEQFHYFSQAQLSYARLTEKGVGMIYTDRDGDLWMGHLYGIKYLNQGKTEFEYTKHTVTHSDNRDFYWVSWVYDDSISGKTFVSTGYADGLNVVDKDGKVSHHLLDRMPGTEKFQMAGKVINDSRNNLWVLSRDFIYQYNRSTNKLDRIEQPIPDSGYSGSPFFANIRESADGKIWIATHRHGIYVFDPATGKYRQLVSRPGNKNSLRSNIITGMDFDPDGKCWIGYKTDGLTCYDPVNDTYLHFSHRKNDPESLVDNQVLTLCADAKGNVWIGTYSGLSLVETSKKPYRINNFIKQQELLGLIIVNVETDHDGNVWFTNAMGLSMYNPVTGEIKSFNFADGLMFGGNSMYLSRGRKGEMIITTFAGYFRFRPSELIMTDRPSEVLITSMMSGQKQVLFENELKNNKKVSLRADDNLFNIEFVSLNYKSQSGLTYYYRLVGLDEAWKTTTTASGATYTHLPGGDYVFEIKAVNGAGMWSKTTRVPIFIATPFYKTAWFSISIVLMITGAIFALYRMRVRSIEKTEAIKTSFNKQIAETEMRALRAQMNPHFIFNCLNSINRYIIKNDHKTASLYLTKFAKLIRLILDNSETHMVSLAQELEALKLYIDIEALRFDHRFNYEIELDEGLNTDSIQIPPMIIQPFVENAIWHGLLHKETHGKMYLRFMIEDDCLVCEIEDDGIGREKAKEMKSKSATTRKSLGLKITADRLAILQSRTDRQGGIAFEDLKDKNNEPAGTKVTIRIPVDTD